MVEMTPYERMMAAVEAEQKRATDKQAFGNDDGSTRFNMLFLNPNPPEAGKDDMRERLIFFLGDFNDMYEIETHAVWQVLNETPCYTQFKKFYPNFPDCPFCASDDPKIRSKRTTHYWPIFSRKVAYGPAGKLMIVPDSGQFNWFGHQRYDATPINWLMRYFATNGSITQNSFLYNCSWNSAKKRVYTLSPVGGPAIVPDHTIPTLEDLLTQFARVRRAAELLEHIKEQKNVSDRQELEAEVSNRTNQEEVQYLEIEPMVPVQMTPKKVGTPLVKLVEEDGDDLDAQELAMIEAFKKVKKVAAN
jgi:hypothetical protein